MYVLFETAGGFALFKVLKEKKLKDVDNLHTYFEDAEGAGEIVKLKSFAKFKDTKDAMKSLEKIIAGKLSKSLSKFLTKHMVSKGVDDELLVAEKKLGKAISEKL
jgi:nucleolar protein 58